MAALILDCIVHCGDSLHLRGEIGMTCMGECTNIVGPEIGEALNRRRFTLELLRTWHRMMGD